MGIDPHAAGQATDLDPFLARARKPTEIDALRQQIREATLAASLCIREPQFSRISARDVAVVFERYDALFFGASIPAALRGRELTFRLSTRATSRGGSLRVWRPRETADGARRAERYELSVSTTLLFESFRGPGRPITIAGRECSDRLDALQRIVEHEMVHLVEQLRWCETDCAAPRFQSIARRLFGHTQHRHELVTPRERAAQLGLQPGHRVAFDFERYEGILSRVTKRATVLVPHPDGRVRSDGNTYYQFYVPLERLGLTNASRPARPPR
jgi:hypothetical protein